VSVKGKYKKARLVFDSTFQPDLNLFAINNWTTSPTKLVITFQGSFQRLLVWIWNLRASFPGKHINLGEDNITKAFWLIKNNPRVAGMCGYRAYGYLGFATGQTFGTCTLPAIFNTAFIAHQQHGR